MLVLAALLAMTTSPTTVYVALGDSTGVGVGAAHGGGYPARLVRRAEREGLPIELVNLCVSGARLEDLVADQLDRAVAARPAVITIGIGINDVTRGTDPEAFRAEYERVADALASTRAHVLVLNVLDLSLSPLAVGEETRRVIRGRIDAINAVIGAVAHRHGFALVDLFSSTRQEMSRPGLFSRDRFHPSEAGYERWTDHVQASFEAAVRASAASRRASLSTERPLR